MPLIPMTIQEQTARDVKFKRRLLRLSQAELAKLAGTSQTAIARLEQAKGNPTVDLIQRLSTALDLEITLHIRPEH